MSKTLTSKTMATRSGPVWDWAAGHGPVTGALSATTGAFAVATTGAATGMPPGWALAAGTAGAIGHTVAGLCSRLAARTIATRAASWLVAAGWTTWAISYGPLSWAALGSLATIGVGMATATRSTLLHEEARELEAVAAEQRQVAAELSAERREIADEWIDRIQRVCGIGLRVLAVEKWPTGTGFSIDAALPAGGATWDSIQRSGPQLAADAQLPHGCTVTATPGINQGRVIIDVTTVNVLVEERAYPSTYTPLSILTGIPWGYRTNADDICVHLREQCALVVGPTGSGKTNLIHVILAGFARATDVLTWVIDLNAGSAGLPWVRPAFDAHGAALDEVKPGIDWLASTYDEAMTMLNTALAVARHRKVAYQELMARHNTDLLPISPQIPQIMLVIDEGAEILTSTDRAMRTLADRILEVIRIARAMGIRTVLTALGATASVLGNLMIRREAKTRVVLTGGESEGMDLSRVFPGSRGLRTDQAPYKGAGFFGTPTTPPGLFKTWRILPNQIADIVHATTGLHPDLDEPSRSAATDYTDRWSPQRTAWMRTTTPITSTPPTTGTPTTTAGSPPGLNLSALQRHRRDHAGMDDVDRLAEQFMKQIDDQFGTTTEPSTSTTAGSPPGLNLSALRGQREQGPAWLPTVLTAIRDAGAQGMKPSAIADLVGKDRKTVRSALQAAVDRGELVYRDNGPHSVYVHPDHA